MHTYVCVCTRMCAYAHVYVCMHTYLCVCTRECVYAQKHVRRGVTCVCINPPVSHVPAMQTLLYQVFVKIVRMHTYMCEGVGLDWCVYQFFRTTLLSIRICIYIHIYTYMHTCIYMYTYVYTYTQYMNTCFCRTHTSRVGVAYMNRCVCLWCGFG